MAHAQIASISYQSPLPFTRENGRHHPAPRTPTGQRDFVSFLPAQLLYVWFCYNHGALDYLTARVYFSLWYMTSAWRPTRPRRCYGRYPPLAELCGLLGSHTHDPKRIQQAIRQLRAVGLVGPDTWAPMAPAAIPPAARQWLAQVTGRKRFLIPRAHLQALACSTAKTPVLMAVLLGAQVRHLWRQYPASPDRLCFLSPSWVAKHFKVSAREVARVMARAGAAGSPVRIERLPSSPAHAYRHGALRRITIQPVRTSRPRARVHSVRSAQKSRGTVMSGLRPARGTVMTPLYKSGDPCPLGKFAESRDPADAAVQAPTATPPEQHAGGIHEKEQLPELSPVSEPLPQPTTATLTNVRPDDLSSNAAVQGLYEQACVRGWLRNCDADRLYAFTAAEHATHAPDIANRPGLFRQMLCEGRHGEHAGYITDAEEDRARKRLRALREPPPQPALQGVVGQATPPQRDPTPALSQDALVVATITADLRQAGYLGDPFHAFKRHVPQGREWARERWQQAADELQRWRARDGP